MMTEFELRHLRYREALSAFSFALGVTAAVLRPEARFPLLWMALVCPLLSLLDRLLSRRSKR